MYAEVRRREGAGATATVLDAARAAATTGEVVRLPSPGRPPSALMVSGISSSLRNSTRLPSIKGNPADGDGVSTVT